MEAARNMQELFNDLTAQNVVSNHVSSIWNFNPLTASHFGGLWEAAIKSTKAHLKRVIGNQTLTMEEFHTLITRIEGILNSHSLTPISSYPNDLCALTPGHYLIS